MAGLLLDRVIAMFDFVSATVLGSLMAFNAWAFRRLRDKNAVLDGLHAGRAAERAKAVAESAGAGEQAFLSDGECFFGFHVASGEDKENDEEDEESKAQEAETEVETEAEIGREVEPETKKMKEREAGEEVDLPTEHAKASAWASAQESMPESTQEFGQEFMQELAEEINELAKDIEGLKLEVENIKAARRVSREAFKEALRERMEGLEGQVSQLGKLVARHMSEVEELKSRKTLEREIERGELSRGELSRRELPIAPSKGVNLKRVPNTLLKLKRRKEGIEAQLKALKFRYLKRAISRREFQNAWNEKQQALNEITAQAMRLIESRSGGSCSPASRGRRAHAVRLPHRSPRLRAHH